MKLKVLVTGKNLKVARDICEHLETDRGYMTVKCPPSKSALFDLTLAELPRVVIVCMGDETVDTISAYNVLKKAAKQGNCTVIVIASEEDEAYFIKHTELTRVLFLSRPVSLFALYEKLNDIEEELNRNKDSLMSTFREYLGDEAEEHAGKKHILVVDDDSEQLVHIREQLEEFYDVSLVKSGDAMFKFLFKKIPDLILLDYLMPDKDGGQVLRQMRSIDDYASIPVIFLTGVTEKSTVIQLLSELRPQGYIVKPAKKSEIVAKIIDALE
ncbi:MAG: response regulator [Lachnospiraceae bacterium]|nr:response regulator [Lachnospiraceae bacterium]